MLKLDMHMNIGLLIESGFELAKNVTDLSSITVKLETNCLQLLFEIGTLITDSTLVWNPIMLLKYPFTPNFLEIKKVWNVSLFFLFFALSST